MPDVVVGLLAHRRTSGGRGQLRQAALLEAARRRRSARWRARRRTRCRPAARRTRAAAPAPPPRRAASSRRASSASTSRFAAPCSASSSTNLTSSTVQPRTHSHSSWATWLTAWRDDVAVEAHRAHQQLAPDQQPDGRLEAEVGRDHALAPVRRRAQPLDVAARRLPGVVVQEALARALDREVAEVLLEVHAVEQVGLRLALLHRRLERDAVRDRVGQRVARGAREREPDPVLDERRHLEVLAQEVDPLGREVVEHALARARCAPRPRSAARRRCRPGSRAAPTSGPGRGTRTSRPTRSAVESSDHSPRPSSKWTGQPRSRWRWTDGCVSIVTSS